MSKGNLFLGFGRGKVGDVVFSRVNGEQVTRARNRHPKNPQTPLQILQRVTLKTIAGAYSFFKPLCDHSFQDLTTGTQNQSRFVELNVEMFRRRTEALRNSDDLTKIYTSQLANFSKKNSTGCEVNRYFISEGSIMSLGMYWSKESSTSSQSAYEHARPYFEFRQDDDEDWTNVTYRSFIANNNLQQGDQLTFILLGADDSTEGLLNLETSTFNTLRYWRVILDPASGDLDTQLFTGGTSEDAVYRLEINDPNPRNSDQNLIFQYVPDTFSSTGTTMLGFSGLGVQMENGHKNTIIGAAIIVSRKSGNTWQRSTEYISFRDLDSDEDIRTQASHTLDFLGEACLSYLSSEESSLYLNAAK